MKMTNNKQTELKSTEEVNIEMRRSFSWDRAFFTSDGFLAAEELSSMIEGGVDDDVKHELQKIEELETMEAKLFQDIESSTVKSTATGKRDSQAKKVTAAGGPHKDAPIKIAPVRSGGSPRNNVKTPTRKSMSPKTGKANADSPSKTPPGITTKNKVASVNTRVSRTSPASPVSPGSPGSSSSSSSTFSASQRSKRSGSVPVRSLVKNEKPSATNALKNDDWKSSKPAVNLMPKTQSSISLRIKPAPVVSHPSSPSTSTTQPPSKSSSSSNSTVDQRSKSRGIKGSTVAHHTSKKTSTNHPTGHTMDLNVKQLATTCKTGSTNPSNARKLPSAKTVAAANKGSKPTSPKSTNQTVAAANTGSKPNSPKTTAHKKQSKGMEHILIISPEILDLKGKINALRMEIDMHKKERCNKMVNA